VGFFFSHFFYVSHLLLDSVLWAYPAASSPSLPRLRETTGILRIQLFKMGPFPFLVQHDRYILIFDISLPIPDYLKTFSSVYRARVPFFRLDIDPTTLLYTPCHFGQGSTFHCRHALSLFHPVQGRPSFPKVYGKPSPVNMLQPLVTLYLLLRACR